MSNPLNDSPLASSREISPGGVENTPSNADASHVYGEHSPSALGKIWNAMTHNAVIDHIEDNYTKVTSGHGTILNDFELIGESVVACGAAGALGGAAVGGALGALGAEGVSAALGTIIGASGGAFVGSIIGNPVHPTQIEVWPR